MILLTGAAGFIGSCFLTSLLKSKMDVVVSDDFSRMDKKMNLVGKTVAEYVDRDNLDMWLKNNGQKVKAIYHLGARTDTTETNHHIFQLLNVEFSKMVWKHCVEFSIPLCYASSAATYGDGSLGYSDMHELVHLFAPLNPYGQSKQDFDMWALNQKETPPRWYGMKFFNVYGPNEYHKGRMASVVYHAYKSILEKEYMLLFKSHKPEFNDGEQSRDFIYVFDVVDMCRFLIENNIQSGIYNAGTGNSRTFYDLTLATFDAMDILADIRFIDTPKDIRDTYQYFTEADMSKMVDVGYNMNSVETLESGVNMYVTRYLDGWKYA